MDLTRKTTRTVDMEHETFSGWRRSVWHRSSTSWPRKKRGWSRCCPGYDLLYLALALAADLILSNHSDPINCEAFLQLQIQFRFNEKKNSWHGLNIPWLRSIVSRSSCRKSNSVKPLWIKPTLVLVEIYCISPLRQIKFRQTSLNKTIILSADNVLSNLS